MNETAQHKEKRLLQSKCTIEKLDIIIKGEKNAQIQMR